MEYLFQNETFLIRKCMMNVFNELGNGFLEKVYQEALAIEFQNNGIPFEREARIPVYYKNVKLQQEYIADFICYDNIIVEVKAISELTGSHKAQVINYLKATNLQVGLLVNFGASKIKVERLFNKIS
ncbi:MAG: GxxExxY protein [Bacteroidales bacterium]|nr:GxxExxY protein [Bacteroidales bacterium]